jgi:hypothetical protein
MNSVKFDKTYWINQIKSELGLAPVPYEELDQHKVSMDFSFFPLKEGESSYISAKEYVDNQLLEIEAKYKEFEEQGISEIAQNVAIPMDDMLNNINSQLNGISRMFDSVPDDVMETLQRRPEEAGIWIGYHKPVISQSNMLCFDVLVENLPYVVVIHDDGTDSRIKDQIKHVLNTTFFIEMRDKTTINDDEQVISYYQFVNAIQPFLVKEQSINDRIRKETETIFEGGVKIDGF